MAQESLKLLNGVREVAALAAPAEPQAVTQRAFDAARERSAAHASLPRARQITERLGGLSWAEVLAIAHAPVKDQVALLGAKDREPSSADWLNEKHVVAVLQIVAKRLRTRRLSRHAYSAEREKLLAEDRARYAHGRLPLPTAHQITRVTGSWGRRCAARDRARSPSLPRPRHPTTRLGTTTRASPRSRATSGSSPRARVPAPIPPTTMPGPQNRTMRLE